MKAADATSLALRKLKAERNFISFPFFALSNRDAARRKRAEITIEFRGPDGAVEQTTGQVFTADGYTFPTPFDKRVHKALEYLITQRGQPIQNPFPFTAYEVLKVLGMAPHSGANIAKVKESLERITVTTIRGERTIYSKAKNRRIEGRVFRVLDQFIYSGEERADGTASQCHLVKLSSWYLENLERNHVRPLDFAYYKTLGNDVACRLYELVGLPFYGVFMNKAAAVWRRSYVTYDYHELCGQLPLTPERYFSEAQRQLNPAHTRLKDTGFLGKVEWSKKVDAWEIRYFPGARACDEFQQFQGQFEAVEQLEMALLEPTPAAEPPEASQAVVSTQERGRSRSEPENGRQRPNLVSGAASEAGERLLRLLADRGVKPGPTAERLVAEHPERIPRQVAVFDWLKRHEPGRITGDGPGFLVASIRDNYDPPSLFVTAQELEERAAAKREAGRVLLAEYQRRAAEVQAEVGDWAKLPAEQRVNPFFINEWETNFRRRNNRNPSDDERQRRADQLVANLRTPEDEFGHRLKVLRSEFEQQAATQGLEFPPE